LEPAPADNLEINVEEAMHDVTVTKELEHDKYGLDIDDATNNPYLVVLKVKEGLFDDWNQRQASSKTKVLPGDRIMEVNSVNGNALSMIRVLASSSSVRLKIARSAPKF